MKLLRKMTAFILAFGLLAGTVAAMSAAVYEGAPAAVKLTEKAPEPTQPAEGSKSELAGTAAEGYTPRLTAPEYTNKYYYSDLNIFYKYGWGMPNCTCYAWGRAYEILKKAPNLCVYSAYMWYDYNKENGFYAYGDEPRPGAIACWVYSSGTSGHVAVVETVEDGVITFSNSAYGGTEFYTSTAPVSDPSDGRSTWIFQGYIYIGDYEIPADNTQDRHDPGDVYRITSEDGVNLRKGPGTSYQVIGCITYGKSATVTKTKKAEGYTWGYTNYEGSKGWFVLDFAKLIYRDTEPDDPPADDPPAEAPTQSPSQAPAEPAPQTQPVREVMMGDLDSDGYLTIMDATRVQMIIAEMYVPTKYMLTAGDYDGDSFFSIMDAGRIRHDIAFDLA